jgi:hypothetical protein
LGRVYCLTPDFASAGRANKELSGSERRHSPNFNWCLFYQ